MKKVLCLIFSLIFTLMVCSAAIPAVCAAQKTSARLYNVYGDGMIFKQNSEAILSGVATAGSKIECEVKNISDEVIASGNTVTGSDGKFDVSFNSPSGGYEEYTVTLYENGTEFAKLSEVVFGEVWLASGQSNMELNLSITTKGEEMQKTGERGSEWLRLLYVPSAYNGSHSNVPAEPVDEANGAFWTKADSDKIFIVSGVAYFFGQKLQKDLDMPVGIVDAALGGSTIRSWLSRETIEGCDELMAYYKDTKNYTSLEKWDKTEHSLIADLTANYNTKINTFKNFRFSGMIWYQGESDIGSPYGIYSKQLELLQSSYSELFNYDGKLPFIFTQLASYNYGDGKDFRLQKMNIEFTDFVNADPSSRAVTTISDVPLTYKPESHAIHPLVKDPVGERMAFCAEGLVYGMHSMKTAASVDNIVFSGNEAVITFKETCDGLVSDSDMLTGFAMCSANGIYLAADAYIISENKVKVTCDNISDPVSVSYAVSQYNGRSDLYTCDGGYKMPVSPFITNPGYTYHLAKDNGWTDCEQDKIWRSNDNELTGYYDTWTASNAVLEFEQESACKGNNGLRIKSSSAVFSVSPVLLNTANRILPDVENDFHDYKTLSFSVRNNGVSDITFSGLKIGRNFTWCAPAVNGTSKTDTVIPADGEWHKITLDLTNIYNKGLGFAKMPGSFIKNFNSLTFEFKNSDGISDISFDNVEFETVDEPSAEKSFDLFGAVMDIIDNIYKFFNDIFGGKVC